MYQNENKNKRENSSVEPEIAASSEETELNEQELDEVSGGITPIPIPYVALTSPILTQSLKTILASKSFEGGGGIE